MLKSGTSLTRLVTSVLIKSRTNQHFIEEFRIAVRDGRTFTCKGLKFVVTGSARCRIAAAQSPRSIGRESADVCASKVGM